MPAERCVKPCLSPAEWRNAPVSHELECTTCRERLPWYVARSLAAEEYAEVERHLFTCASCRQELEDWRAINRLVQRATHVVPPDTRLTSRWNALAAQLPT